jgi:hypothetical protein
MKETILNIEILYLLKAHTCPYLDNMLDWKNLQLLSLFFTIQYADWSGWSTPCWVRRRWCQRISRPCTPGSYKLGAQLCTLNSVQCTLYAVQWTVPPIAGDMDEGTLKTPISKCRLHWYTSIVPSSMGATVHKLGQKYQPMSECISSL